MCLILETVNSPFMSTAALAMPKYGTLRHTWEGFGGGRG